MNKKINFASAHLPNSLIKTVGEVIKSKWLAHGKYTNNFESLFTKFTEIKYATTVSSCTAGLHLCCMALNIKKGDSVLAFVKPATGRHFGMEVSDEYILEK